MDKKHHILVCDDEVNIRESIKACLEDRYEVSLAQDAQGVIESLRSSDPDVIIMDIKMPGVNGLEAIHKIKKAKPDLKIVVLTGYESLSIAEEAIKLGIASYLTKPAGKEKLLRTIAETLNKKRD